MSSHTKTNNILFLGDTQSGKSTFVEHLRKYADPAYVVNRHNIGDGIFSFTKNVILTPIVTSIPSHILTLASNEGRVRVDYGDFINGDLDDYEDGLDDIGTYQLERQDPGTSLVTFNLIDTLGLNDTSLFDETNLAAIFKTLASIKSVNLVVITLSNNPFTEGLVDALKAYVKLFPDLNDNTVFVLTRIDYAKLHPDDTHLAHCLSERKNILGRLLGRHPVPHLLIDNDIGTRKIVRDCITQSTLSSPRHDQAQQARTNPNHAREQDREDANC